MRANWEVKKLGEVCLIRPPKKEARDRLKNHDFVSFVPMEDLGVMTKYFTPTKERRLQEVSGSYTYFSDDDVLVAKITPCFENGKIGVARNLKNGVGFGSSEFLVFRSEGRLVPDYLYYFLSRDQLRQEGAKVMTGAVGHKRVPKEFIENQEISFPISTSEQQRIVDALDEAFAAIAKAKENAEKNLQNSRQLFESYLESIFANPSDEWLSKKLGMLCSKIGSGATPRGGNKSYKTAGVTLIRSLNVYDRRFEKKNLAFLDQQQADDLANVTLHARDVLLNITGASVARCCIAPDECLPARVNQHVSIIRPRQEIITSSFLNYLLTSKVYKDRLLNTGAQGGSTRQAITKAQIQDFLITFPESTRQQNTIVTKLDALSAESRKLEAIYQKKLADLEELKKSMLQKAFNGELTGVRA